MNRTMKGIASIRFTILFFLIGFMISCSPRKQVDITPHHIHPQADRYYKKAISLMMLSYDIDSTHKCITFLDQALQIDSFNPDYYGVKAKLLAELGELDAALFVQTCAAQKGAITGEYLFQLGLFQSAKEMLDLAHQSFGKSKEYLEVVLQEYPDSLGAFFLQQAATALYLGNDSLFMKDIDQIRKRYPNRLMEIEMTRRVKPHILVKEIKKIEEKRTYTTGFDVDSLIKETLSEK